MCTESATQPPTLGRTSVDNWTEITLQSDDSKNYKIPMNKGTFYFHHFYSHLTAVMADSPVILFNGGVGSGFGEGLYAVPIAYLWEGQG